MEDVWQCLTNLKDSLGFWKIPIIINSSIIIFLDYCSWRDSFLILS